MVTIAELGPGWLARQTHLKPSALRPLEIAWRVHVEPRWGSVRLSEVRFTDAQQWVSEMTTGGASATTVMRNFGVLAAILDDAARDRLLVANPVRGVKMPRKTTERHTYLTHDQVHALANGAGGANGVMVLVLAYTRPTPVSAGVSARPCGLRIWTSYTGRSTSCSTPLRSAARCTSARHDAGRLLGPVPRGSGRRGGRVRPCCAGPGCGFFVGEKLLTNPETVVEKPLTCTNVRWQGLSCGGSGGI
jgi:hypothetical protein